MIICGLKLTHDGAIAILDNSRLIFSIEMEKLMNNERYTSIEHAEVIQEVVATFGYKITDINRFVIDGWGGFDKDALAVQPRLEIGNESNRLTIQNMQTTYQLEIAQYRERNNAHSIVQKYNFHGLKIDNHVFDYSSYLHVTGHVMSAYCTSPFAENNEGSYVLVWDGGMYPRLYYIDPLKNEIENFNPIFLLIGNIYSIFSQHFGPFKAGTSFAKDDLSIAGKVMAYIAHGKIRRELFAEFEKIYQTSYDNPMGFANVFASTFKKKIEGSNIPDEDILLTFHTFLEELLIAKLKKKIMRFPRQHNNICLAGGCALNIKWNSAIRNSSLFEAVYVPPFPNDSGSAVGMACAELWNESKQLKLDWNVYSGPPLIDSQPAQGWITSDCSLKKLAEILHCTNEPIVFLNNRAELGPRALGNRSILAAAISDKMKSILNLIKNREDYRPVSPICLEDQAEKIFMPGMKDTYMLFDHKVRKDWLDKIPAVVHLDQTARLQTITYKENPEITELLTHYHNLSGTPLLCNTSANFKGRGFFPDVQSATKWNKVNYVWSNNKLYEREEKIVF